MLSVLLLISAVALGPNSLAPAASTCLEGAIKIGVCGPVNNGSELTVSATQQQSHPDPDSLLASPDTGHDPVIPMLICQPGPAMVTMCREVVFPPSRSAPAPTRDVILSDLVRFAPDASSFAVEPGGVGIAGMPTNFVVVATPQTRAGTILGIPVSVRFTPVGYDFRYGDGSAQSSADPGRSWEDLGQPEFTPTPTSHTYRERGTYSASVDVRYAAEVDVGTGWTPVDGEITVDGAAMTVRILEANTALVARTCAEDPAATGC